MDSQVGDEEPQGNQRVGDSGASDVRSGPQFFQLPFAGSAQFGFTAHPQGPTVVGADGSEGGHGINLGSV
jgi:hypothetical protein